MKIKDGYKLRELEDTSVVVAAGKEALKFNGMLSLNSAGTFLWKLLVDGATLDELTESVIKEYNIDEFTAKKDIDEFIDKLRKSDILDE